MVHVSRHPVHNLVIFIWVDWVYCAQPMLGVIQFCTMTQYSIANPLVRLLQTYPTIRKSTAIPAQQEKTVMVKNAKSPFLISTSIPISIRLIHASKRWVNRLPKELCFQQRHQLTHRRRTHLQLDLKLRGHNYMTVRPLAVVACSTKIHPLYFLVVAVPLFPLSAPPTLPWIVPQGLRRKCHVVPATPAIYWINLWASIM